jgi:hypothetical protein
MSFIFRYFSLMTLLSLFPLSSLAQGAATSPLVLTTSDPALQKTFDWAKAQALAYVGPGSDPVGDWYEAALPGRHAFCMRDVSHQTMGAFALGLAAQNRNMLRWFAQNVSDSKDWASYWEIDREGKPSSADYQSDDDFWYNLPANFDVMSAALRMYQWTGDATYINDPAFTRFYEHTVSDYPKRWNLEPPAILTRSRIMNRRLTAGKFVQARGIPSYTESENNFVFGVDLLAAEYRAFRFAGELARLHHDTNASTHYDQRALAVQKLIETRAWDPEKHHFYGLGSNQDFFGSGDAFVLYFSATNDPSKVQGALAAIEQRLRVSPPGIEEQSYLPEILYRYGAHEEAYTQILDLSRTDRERREYPEVSYAIIGALVTGMMGVDVTSPLQSKPNQALDDTPVLGTVSRLSGKTDWVELDHLPVRKNVINVRHDGRRSSILINVSGPELLWEPGFYGRSTFLMVNDKKVVAIVTTDHQGRSITTTKVRVPPNSRMVVKMMDADLSKGSIAR